jgi:hypothetical protein
MLKEADARILGNLEDEDFQYDMAKELLELSKENSNNFPSEEFPANLDGFPHRRKAVFQSQWGEQKDSSSCRSSADLGTYLEEDSARPKFSRWEHTIEVSLSVESLLCFVMTRQCGARSCPPSTEHTSYD